MGRFQATFSLIESRTFKQGLFIVLRKTHCRLTILTDPIIDFSPFRLIPPRENTIYQLLDIHQPAENCHMLQKAVIFN